MSWLSKALGTDGDGGSTNWGTIGSVVGFGIGGGTGSAIGGNIGAGMDSANATAAANEQNKKLMREQMAFQERMSSSAHQRQVDDLKAAGLNPMLSGMGGSGASSPSGASTTVAPVDAKIGENIAKSVDTQLQYQQLKNAKAQQAQTEATTAKTEVEKGLLKAKLPEAEMRNKVGKKIQQAYESLSNTSAKDVSSNTKSITRNLFEKDHVRKAENDQKRKYNMSPAAIDAARARLKRKRK